MPATTLAAVAVVRHSTCRIVGAANAPTSAKYSTRVAISSEANRPKELWKGRHDITMIQTLIAEKTTQGMIRGIVLVPICRAARTKVIHKTLIQSDFRNTGTTAIFQSRIGIRRIQWLQPLSGRFRSWSSP